MPDTQKDDGKQPNTTPKSSDGMHFINFSNDKLKPSKFLAYLTSLKTKGFFNQWYPNKNNIDLYKILTSVLSQNDDGILVKILDLLFNEPLVRPYLGSWLHDNFDYFKEIDVFNEGKHTTRTHKTTGKLIEYAIKSRQLQLVKWLVSHKVVNLKKDNSAMELAVEIDAIEIVICLLEHGAYADGTVGSWGRNRTYLGMAAISQNEKLAEQLIKHGATIDSALSFNYQRNQEKKETYIRDEGQAKTTGEKQKLEKSYASLQKSYQDSVRFLMNFAMGTDLSTQNDDPFTYFQDLDVTGINFIGVSVEGVPITREMLQAKNLNGASGAVTTIHDLSKSSATKNSIKLISRLTEQCKSQGACMDQSGVINLVPLSKACEIGDIATVRSRLSAGIIPTGIDLMVAVRQGHLRMVKLFVKHASFNKKSLPEAISLAKVNNKKAVLNYLSQLLDVNQQDANGETLLHYAAKAGDVPEVKRLLQDQKININIRNQYGSTPLFVAVSHSYQKYAGSSKNHIEVIKILLEHKADANIRTYSQSALDEAAEKGSSKAVELLLPRTLKQDVKESSRLTGKKIILGILI